MTSPAFLVVTPDTTEFNLLGVRAASRTSDSSSASRSFNSSRFILNSCSLTSSFCLSLKNFMRTRRAACFADSRILNDSSDRADADECPDNADPPQFICEALSSAWTSTRSAATISRASLSSRKTAAPGSRAAVPSVPRTSRTSCETPASGPTADIPTDPAGLASKPSNIGPAAVSRV